MVIIISFSYLATHTLPVYTSYDYDLSVSIVYTGICVCRTLHFADEVASVPGSRARA